MANVFEAAKTAGVRLVGAKVLGFDLNSNGTMRCPLHNEKKGKSFSVKDDTFWKCFGKCNKNGDVIELVSVAKDLPPFESAKLICDTLGLAYELPKSDKTFPEIDYSFLLGNEKLMEYAFYYLHTTEKVLNYLKNSRQFTTETIAKYKFGYMTKEHYDALASLVDKGECSLENYKAFARHVGRLVIPLHNASGKQVLGFVSRALSVSDPIRYINDSDSEHRYGYHKKVYSYGLNNTVKKTPVVIVEGYFDAPSLVQMGYNTIAMGDASMPAPRFNYLIKLYSKLILGFDNDLTGVYRTLELHKRFKHINFGYVLWPNDIKDGNNALKENAELKYGDFYEYVVNVWKNNINRIRTDYTNRMEFVEKLRDSLSFVKYGDENYFVRREIDKFIEMVLDA